MDLAHVFSWTRKGKTSTRRFDVVVFPGRAVVISTVLLAAGLAIVALVLTACAMIKPQQGGHGSTLINRPGVSNKVSFAQSENPKEPSTQLVSSEQTAEYVLPPGTALNVGSPGASVASVTGEGSGGELARLLHPVPIRITSKDRTETRIGGAQKDTVREWASKAANMRGVMWAGIIMLTLVPGVLLYFGWWTKAAVAACVGISMIVLAQTLPDHGTAILLGGLGAFALAALLVLYAYYKGQLDRNQNGVPDLLERKG